MNRNHVNQPAVVVAPAVYVASGLGHWLVAVAAVPDLLGFSQTTAAAVRKMLSPNV